MDVLPRAKASRASDAIKKLKISYIQLKSMKASRVSSLQVSVDGQELVYIRERIRSGGRALQSFIVLGRKLFLQCS